MDLHPSCRSYLTVTPRSLYSHPTGRAHLLSSRDRCSAGTSLRCRQCGHERAPSTPWATRECVTDRCGGLTKNKAGEEQIGRTVHPADTMALAELYTQVWSPLPGVRTAGGTEKGLLCDHREVTS